MRYTRRDIIKLGAAAVPASVLGSRLWAAARPKSSVLDGVEIGVIAPYSFHNMPDDAHAVLADLLTVGLSGLEMQHYCAEQFAGAPTVPPAGRRGQPLSAAQKAARAAAQEKLKAWRLSAPMETFHQLRQLYKNAGVEIYSVKLAGGRFPVPMSEAECRYAFDLTEALGARSLQIEFPEGKPEVTAQLGAEAARRKMMVGYHAHLDASPSLWDEALKQSPYNGINLDIGHWVAAGNPGLLEFIRAHHARITTLHIKDRKSKADGGANVVWGEGDTPVAAVLRLMRAERYRFPASIEFEYPVPAGSTSLKEVTRCFQFCQTALSA